MKVGDYVSLPDFPASRWKILGVSGDSITLDGIPGLHPASVYVVVKEAPEDTQQQTDTSLQQQINTLENYLLMIDDRIEVLESKNTSDLSRLTMFVAVVSVAVNLATLLLF